ncbi:MAG: FmdB family zinc ribbon protein [bacterium]
MPLYEFLCAKCGSRDEVFSRTMKAEVIPPKCKQAGREKGHEMKRIVSKFVRHKTIGDQLEEAEAKYGKEVEAAMGPEPDIGKYARRYDALAKNLPDKV